MGLSGQLTRALGVYARTAWWGLVAPWVHEREALVVAQGVILRRAGECTEILLSVRSDVQGWELPGGTPEPGEPIAETLRREVQEETGLDVAVVRHVGDYRRTGFRPHTASVHVCEVVGGRLRPSRETPVVRWFDVGALPDTLFPWYVEPVADAVAERSEPVERVERQGLGAVWAGIRIDVSMRWRARRSSGAHREATERST